MKLICAAIAIMTLLNSATVFAYNNTYAGFWFQANGQQEFSDPVIKENDGDTKYYVTTLATYGGVASDVFSNYGTFYCRSRISTDLGSSTHYSNLLTFTNNTAKNTSYLTASHPIQWNKAYCLRAEVSGATYGWDERVQNVRWCP